MKEPDARGPARETLAFRSWLAECSQMRISEGGRGQRLRAGAGALLLSAVLLLPSAWVVQRALRYALFYEHSRFNPASVSGERPTYFYIDWREDARSARRLGSMLEAAATSGRAAAESTDPLSVIQEALALHDLLLDEPTLDREAVFRREVDWIAKDAVSFIADSIPVWPQRDAFPRYGLRGPWISALTQGQAISLLIRAATYTGETRYADLARAAARAFTIEESQIVWRAGGAVFFEEFPCRPPAHALNGCLLAWLGVWDLARYDEEPSLRRQCEDWLRAFQPIVRQHELGQWTRYDLHQVRPTSPAYHELHAALAETLAAITGDPFWVARAIRWHESAGRPEERLRVFLAVASHKIGALIHPPVVRPAGIGLNS